MRHVGTVAVVVAFALAAGGCGGGDERTGAAASPSPGDTWSLLVTGSATPSPTPSLGVRPSAAATAGLPSANPSCTRVWPPTEPVLIPVAVTPVPGGFRVEWPRQYDSNYRVTAVPQELVAGAQPEPVWKNVPAGTGCTISTTLTGLNSGDPYIVWLDAPNTGRQPDGTRHPYSGRSSVVYPG
ncbi:hypothetical protein [Actinoplanes teichomyceticus]|uniref:Fibronectin type-III domain-containing protein n=1 Tax=Actinoplanes teichomyceticus TaxID=1867 RepID=A0A561WSI0_ACTTI|nr:hypothetical protein [Actinoplanes teichomyceticus]TWG26817.1 hypothetical protein FHX34_1011817 [Actinoplanes teichomyceticus]GIF15216.1 hypothetical protein Ate01nite_52480 [Actinoplanes teichomyceticus]